MSFKTQMEADVATVLNTEEFACEIVYNGETIKAIVRPEEDNIDNQTFKYVTMKRQSIASNTLVIIDSVEHVVVSVYPPLPDDLFVSFRAKEYV